MYSGSTLSTQGTTLERHILEQQTAIPGATGDFTALFQQIALAAKVINSRVRSAGLAGILGLTGEKNVQGEEVQKLDEFANNVLIRSVEAGGHLCVMLSEENEEIVRIPEKFSTGKYVLLFDPLDGSSNIDVDINIGTIFSIHRRVTKGDGHGTEADCLQRGSEQVAAGYVIYGSSTVLVYTAGYGVHGFTLDPAVGEFFLSHENIRIPQRGKIYSVNEGNSQLWPAGLRRWVADMQTPKTNPDGTTRGPYSARYVGSLVADFHRTLLKGGVFAYPADRKSPNGKLRLLYEAAPMALLCEAAGGAASDGTKRILDVVPTALHQRVPLYIGSRDEVAAAERFLREE